MCERRRVYVGAFMRVWGVACVRVRAGVCRGRQLTSRVAAARWTGRYETVSTLQSQGFEFVLVAVQRKVKN